ncbi:MAG: multiheme c-type cytochrome [Gammaproteobacteria bacterium]
MVAAVSLLAVTGQPKPGKTYVGAQACGACHSAQQSQQSAGGHAHSLRPAAEHSLAKSFLPKLEMPVEWAFGSGGQAVTFVSQVDEDSYLEHYFTYYSAARAMDVTPGHSRLEPKTRPATRGVFYKTFDPDPKIMRCFRCHSTGRLSLGPKLDIRPAEPGVRCEACHGPGSLHVKAAGAGELLAARRAIVNPGRLRSWELNQLCGNCHRKPAPAGSVSNWNDPWNTRHQPLYLDQSACFQKSQGKLSCLTCHDPHKPLQKNQASHYNARCAACHTTRAHPKLEVREANLEDCVRCHMPAVAPREHLRFTNHWIGVYLGGANLTPKIR